MSRLRILLVAYFFPPTRDTGAQRPAAMAKYLTRLGHEVTVLTTNAFGTGGAGPGLEGVAVLRASDLSLLRARMAGQESIGSLFDSDSYSGKPHPLSYAIVPEPLAVAWAPAARRAALRAHRSRPFDAVISTSPPESAHAVGLALHKRGVPWVADIRDAWTFEPLRPAFPLAAQNRLDEHLERRWLGAADRVVCVSEPAAADLRDRGIADPVVIANAWDPDADPSDAEVAAARAEFDPERLSLLYTGRFGSYGRDPGALLEALTALGREQPAEAAKLELVVAGPLTAAEQALFERDVSPARIRLLGAVDRPRALALQRAAGALLLIAQAARSQLVNFKLFEYLAAGRPILALAAGTEAGRIVTETGTGSAVRGDDPVAIGSALSELLTGEPAAEVEAAATAAAARYSYPAAAEAMSGAVESAISSRKNSSPSQSRR